MYKDLFGKVRKFRIDSSDVSMLEKVINSEQVNENIREYLKVSLEDFRAHVERKKELWEDEVPADYNFPVMMYLPYMMEDEIEKLPEIYPEIKDIVNMILH